MTLIFRVRPTSFHSESCWEPELRYVMMHGEHAQLYDMFQSKGHHHAKYTPPSKVKETLKAYSILIVVDFVIGTLSTHLFKIFVR